MSEVDMRDLGQAYLIGGHREGVNVTLLRGVAVREVELQWIKQFRGHVTNSPWLRCCRGTWLRNGGVCDDTYDSKVPEACDAPLGDQDVPLGMTRINTCPNPTAPFITHRIDVTVYDAQ